MTWLKQTYYGALLSIVFAVANVSTAFATTLTQGDIAIVGVWSDSSPMGKAFAFVTLVPLEMGTVISFSDNGARTDGSLRTTEGTIDYTTTAAVPACTVITVGGMVADFNLSTMGDQIFVYQGTWGAMLTGTLVWGVNLNGDGVWQADGTDSNSSALPPISGFPNIALPELDNYAYTGPTTGTRGFLIAALQNVANWTGSDAEQPTFPASFTLTTGAGDGTDCSDAAECSSGFCNDGVCCATNCGEDPHDCQACSSAAGAAVNGTCGPASNTTVCRAALSSCDIVELCDGASTTCPTDAVQESGTACSDGDLCNGDETCDDVGECMPGTSLSCDDSDACTADTCDAIDGCMNVSIDGCGSDGGVPDDAGLTDDAGMSDDAGAIEVDAGIDATVPTDDAGATPTDSGTPGTDAGPSTEPNADSGCSCDAAGANARLPYGVAIALLGALFLIARRRRDTLR